MGPLRRFGADFLQGAVADLFMAALGHGPGSERVMALAWRDARVLAVERERPHATSGGKVLHVQVDRAPRS